MAPPARRPVGRFIPSRTLPRSPASTPAPRSFSGVLARTRAGTLGDLGLSMTVANSASTSPGSNASSYTEWLAAVQANGGVGTMLNKSTAARYPAATIAANLGVWDMPDSWTAAGDWGYYYAPEAVDRDAGTLVVATPGEIAQGAAELQSEWWKGPIKAIGLTIAGGLVLSFVLHQVGGDR